MILSKGILALFLAFAPGLRADTPPAWVQNQGADAVTYPANTFLTGYGLSSPGGTEAEQRRQALAMAQQALASSIRTSVTSEFTSRVTQQDKRMSHYAQNVVRTKADLELQGLDAPLVWRDPKANVTHALAVLDKPKALLLLDGQLRSQARACAKAFDAARASRDPQALVQARQLRERMEEQLLIQAVLSGAPAPDLPCPAPPEILAELRKVYATQQGLDRHIALAALDLSADLPKGIRVLMDRITFADTPFCGSLSAYLEQALASQLSAVGLVKILDKTQTGDAQRDASLEGGLAQALQSQAAVRGVVFDLGEDVKVVLRVTAATGEELSSSTISVPALLVKKAGLTLVPENYQEARKILEICDARVERSKLQVKLALDRGVGGIYRKGDKLHLFLKANMDCYVKVLYHQVDGTQVLIFPNRFHPGGRIEKDRLYQLPPDDNSFDLSVQEPFGAEMVKVIASTDPIEIDAKEAGDSGLKVVREDLAGLLVRTRGIALSKAEVQYTEATAVVNTMAAVK